MAADISQVARPEAARAYQQTGSVFAGGAGPPRASESGALPPAAVVHRSSESEGVAAASSQSALGPNAPTAAQASAAQSAPSNPPVHRQVAKYAAGQ